MNFKNYNFKNKRALVRVDFNVPLNDSGLSLMIQELKWLFQLLKKSSMMRGVLF